jgi:type II secretion system protein I
MPRANSTFAGSAEGRASPARETSAGKRRRSGAALLEVLLALTIFAMSAAVVGSAMRSSLRAVTDLRQAAKAADLAESVLAELSIGALELVETPPTAFEQDEQDRPSEEGWTYEIAAEDVSDVPGLKKVTVIVTDNAPYRPITRQLTQWMLDPNAAAETGEPQP